MARPHADVTDMCTALTPPSRARLFGIGSDRVLGYVVTAILPALFWTVVAAALCPALGYEPGAAALGAIAVAVSLFLAAIYSSLTVRWAGGL